MRDLEPYYTHMPVYMYSSTLYVSSILCVFYLGQKSRSLASGVKLTFDDSCCESLSSSTGSLKNHTEEGDSEQSGKGICEHAHLVLHINKSA